MPSAPVTEKRCSRCKIVKPRAAFSPKVTAANGLHPRCKICTAEVQKVRDQVKSAQAAEADAKVVAEAEAQARRLASDFEPLKPHDFDVGELNPGKRDPRANQEKRQEYSRDMGRFMGALGEAGQAQAHGRGSVLENMPAELGTFVSKVGEQERRFQNRRTARSLSLFAANEVLAMGLFKQAADLYLRDKVTPTGYARAAAGKPARRSVCLLLSDLHLGAELDSLDEPMPFRAIEEARRLEFVLRQALDFKPQYRKHSRLVLFINGDVIEGLLMHDQRSGVPLTEQKVIFWRYFSVFVALCAQQYPEVLVVFQPGNHGRDLVRHAGRATARKWDGHEWEVYYGLQMMCSGLRNVTWQLDFRAVSIVDLHGQNMLATHGDTEVKLGHPDTAAAKNGDIFDRINATRIYGVEVHAAVVGHFHTARYHPRSPMVLYNGALIPPNGHARTSGYIGEPCGQWMWEAVEGFPIGDLRFIAVGRAQDSDERLGTLIQPFRFAA